MKEERLIEKIRGLPPERIDEVEDFVDFLTQRAGRRAASVRSDAIAAYVARHSGTDADLDEELEAAAVEHLLAEREED